ncbi:MAG: exopolyphosphatase [Gammaproteobacteria bacterium]
MSRKSSTILPTTLAAVDLGSNSFHMIIARVSDGQLHTLDRLREMVQLGAGLNSKNQLSEGVQQRAIECLQRFGQRLSGMPPGSVRAVGTNTLRQAHNAQEFLGAAQQALGHPIEIIAGGEEARLIYLGVAHSLADDAGRRLVIDIGGGSTEFIIGERFEPLHMESLEMGCVSSSLRHFPKGIISRANMHRAEIAAQQELLSITAHFRAVGWKSCIGASGTINAIRDVLRANNWGDNISYIGLRKLSKQLILTGNVKTLNMPGLGRERAAVFPGGVAILLAAFESLGITDMLASDGALREGLLYDLLGRIRHEDIRERTVAALSARYHVDVQQAQRVEQTARASLKSLAALWDLKKYLTILGWAARLHEVGLAVSHNQYHKHGAYLIGNSDMPGFSRQDQQLVAALIIGQRGKFPLPVFQEFPDNLQGLAQCLCIMLRLAVLLNRSRSEQPLPRISFAIIDRGLQMKFPKNWLHDHPLTRADLAQEARYLKAVKLNLKIL